MAKFSKRSLKRISECHPDLQKIAHELIKEMDVTVLCGHRGKDEQNEAYRKGHSQLKWPNSKHNKTPSRAIDMAPYPIDWKDLDRFDDMRARIKKIAARLGIKIRHIKWDYPHTELL
jgi:peptidoglycan L-alanyl-D-glutamate endopeptidase CwlK